MLLLHTIHLIMHFNAYIPQEFALLCIDFPVISSASASPFFPGFLFAAAKTKLLLHPCVMIIQSQHKTKLYGVHTIWVNNKNIACLKNFKYFT